MLFIFPFLFLIFSLFLTRNNILALLCGLVGNGIVYLYCFPLVSTYQFVFSVLPRFYVQIFSPSEYLYPLLFFILVSYIIELLKDIKVFDSYALLMSKFFHATYEKCLDLSVVLFSGVLFLDDYLGLFGMKSFFTPLVKNTEKEKLLLTEYSVLVTAAPVLFFFSTWSVVIIKQLALVKSSLSALTQVSSVECFLLARKYFFYPILLYAAFLLRIFFKKSSDFSLKKLPSINAQKIFFIDIFLFLVLPLSIFSVFIYYLWYLAMSFELVDVSLIMFQGAVVALLIIILLVRYYKALSFQFLISFFISTLKDSLSGIFKLTLCWVFSKITFSIMQSYALFSFSSYYAAYCPALYFLISVVITAILGSEWGSLSIMIPLLLFVGQFKKTLILLVLGAIISGVVAGAHLSPVSNTTMMQGAVFEVDTIVLYLKRVCFIGIIAFFSLIGYLVTGLYL